MATRSGALSGDISTPSQCTTEVLVEQIIWLIRLRWIAAGALIAAGLAGTYVFPVLISATPVYICAGVLLLCNIFYFLAARRTAGRGYVILGIVQAEMDLVILTAVLNFAGGVANPFCVFYIFHVIIAAIILPRNLSFTVAATAIVLFGLLAVNELSGGKWLGYYPLRFFPSGVLQAKPVYLLGEFAAFFCMVILTQYLTRVIVVRMTIKEMEAAHNNNVLTAVINAMTEGLLFVSCDGKIAICNPAAKLWKDTVLSKEDAFENFPVNLAEHLKELVACNPKTAGAGKIIKFNTSGETPRYIEARSCPVTGGDGQNLGYVIVGQDLTEHKKLEQDLREQTEAVISINETLKMSRIQMAQREKMVATGQMAAGIAHEIGNPLASLSSVVQYLARRLGSHEEKENLLVMEHQISRISNILKRMLSLSSPAVSEYKWVDTSTLIENTLSLIKFDKRMQSVTVKNSSDAGLPMVWLNPQLFEQVLLNIFINALDAMEAKRRAQKHTLEVTQQFKDGMIEIRISDTGVGMSQEVCERAFESFFTTKEIGKGTGLGLFISNNLVAEIGGTIQLKSMQGEGTTVIIRIPVRPKVDMANMSEVKKV